MTDPDREPRDPEAPPPLKEAPKFTGLKKAFGDGEAHLLGQASAVGLTFVVAILLGLGAGWWLDQKLGTAPWCLLGGILVGIAAGFKNLFTFSARMDRAARRRAEEKKARRMGPPPDEEE